MQEGRILFPGVYSATKFKDGEKAYIFTSEDTDLSAYIRIHFSDGKRMDIYNNGNGSAIHVDFHAFSTEFFIEITRVFKLQEVDF